MEITTIIFIVLVGAVFGEKVWKWLSKHNTFGKMVDDGKLDELKGGWK